MRAMPLRNTSHFMCDITLPSGGTASLTIRCDDPHAFRYALQAPDFRRLVSTMTAATAQKWC